MRLNVLLALCCLSLPLLAQEDIQKSLQIVGLDFDAAEIDSMTNAVRQMQETLFAMREYSVDNSVPPALLFKPQPSNFTPQAASSPIVWQIPKVDLPTNLDDLAFYSVLELASLVKHRKISSLELTDFFLERLKRYGDTLECVITITEDLARTQARKADQEIASGIYHGPLHGIPYGAKDLLALPNYKTTWGAAPYRDQMLDETATVIRKLEEAGAVLVAKLTLGALAWGDVWFGGVTKNPWNLDLGSSGSSAGSASATVAGLVPFSIGTETLGSIVSPSTRCAASGLRPTFGRVSRAGAMALSWSMDKIGPICRSAEDCAVIFDAIRGTDGLDHTLVDAGFPYQPNSSPTSLRVGYFKNLFSPLSRTYHQDSMALLTLEQNGIILQPIQFDIDLPIAPLRIILNAEAAAAFDELTRSNQDTMLVRQIKRAWPNVFRESRLIPAVEYIQANRFRTQLIQEFHDLIKDFDVVITPSFGGPQLLTTNLTGHPCMVVPHGFTKAGSGTSISFIGNLFEEHKIVLLAKYFQQLTVHEDLHPRRFGGNHTLDLDE